MKNLKHTTIFSSLKIKPIVSQEKDRYLALASLLDVGNFIPNIDTSKNIDLLPIAFNACVINRVNKNGDVVDAATAVGMYQSFVNKPINIEHDRQKVVGTILVAGFSEFGTDLPLTEEQVKTMTGPFKITLGGVVWKVVNSRLADIIENSNDPTSEDYQKISASWELGFANYHILLMKEEEKNIEAAEIIDSQEKIDILSSFLRSLGGSGKTEDGKRVYRKVIGEVVPLGIGLTENPAADVIGVAIKIVTAENNEVPLEIENNSSQAQKIDVKTDNRIMKINTIQDITEDSMKELTASAISVFIEDELKKASEKFAEEKGAVEATLKAHQEKNEALTSDFNKVKEELDKVQSVLTELEKAKAAKELEEAFNARMSAFDMEFELDNEDRTLLASDIKDLNEEGFAAYYKKMSVLMKNKKKKTDAKDLTEKQKNLPPFIQEKILKSSEQAAASLVLAENKEDVKELVESALDSAKIEAATIPISSTAKEPTVLEKYKRAFSVDQFEFKK